MKKIIYWVPVMVWMIIIFLFSARQKVAVTDSYALSFLFFKSLHLIEYCFLYILLYRALRNTTNLKNNERYIYALLILLIYAGSDELHQRFVPTREGKIRDVIIDGLGGCIAWILLAQLLPRMPKRLRKWGKILHIS